ncbi:MAG: hypothetical protein DIU76_07635 [Bacillota bacterium]|nr:MAG: hypothetical protein DIU76_07635 [Bacillota bacterium]
MACRLGTRGDASRPWIAPPLGPRPRGRRRPGGSRGRPGRGPDPRLPGRPGARPPGGRGHRPAAGGLPQVGSRVLARGEPAGAAQGVPRVALRRILAPPGGECQGVGRS